MRTTPSIASFSSAVALLGLLGLLLAAPAAAATSTEIVSYLNAQRAANGIPAGITERPDWSQKCAEHNGYMDQNDGLTHDEDRSMPGYTTGGAWAGQNSVLADIGDWTAAQNPFATAPMHLAQLLAPDLAQMGADENTSTGYTCATTWPGDTRQSPAAATGYSYPGNGATGVAASEVAAEDPFTPGEYVGLPAGTETGPYLMAFLDGPAKIDSATISAASLTGPNGPVAVERIGSDNADIGKYMPAPMAFLIPRAPLASGTYDASVSFSYGRKTTPVAFSFTVGDQLGGDPGDGSDPGNGQTAKLKLSAHPKKRSSDRSPSFAFALAGASGFECKLDSAGWKSCTSPTTYRRVASGRHVFRVRATGTASTAPASFRFRIS
jgi:hypothetical protein